MKAIYRNRNILNKFFIYIILFVVMLIPGCDKTGYKTYRFRESDFRYYETGGFLNHSLFTFEYPKVFHLADNYPFKLTPRYTDVSLDYEDISISIYVSMPGHFYDEIDAKTVIKHYEDRTWTQEDRYELIERRQISVSGKLAESITYFFDMNVGYYQERINRIIAFDYEGFVWKIEFLCSEVAYKKYESDFQHLIDTFKFLPPYPEGLKVSKS